MSQPSPQFGKSLFLIPSPQGNHGLLYTGHHRAADGNPILVGQHQPRTIQLLDVVEVYKKGPVRKDKAGIIDFGKQLFDPTVVLKVPLPAVWAAPGGRPPICALYDLRMTSYDFL